MCGITGYWTRSGSRNADASAWARDLDESVRSLRQRGPDDQGTWMSGGAEVGFGHTRLSILDLSPLGRQPMVYEADGPEDRVVMVLNGEIYNFAEIRAELQKLGYTFRSSGDSEVALCALREWGIAAVDRFVGMFAIALWFERERRLWLLRDRLGVKPLYYAWDGGTLWFGSELKALRAFKAWNPEIDRQALGEYFQFGYVSAPRSIYKRVYKLIPGHWLELCEQGDPAVRCYWSASQAREPLAGSESDLEEQLEALLIDAFKYRMVSDVPVGVFLSGGLDSSLVTALLQKHSGQQLNTFTIGFPDPRFDEAPFAREVAAHLGTSHTERVMYPEEMASVLTRWADLFDEPFGDCSGVPTYLVSRVARESVKVALSADGGDELFSGYSHYGVALARERALTRMPRGVRSVMSQSLQRLPAASLQAIVERLPLPGQARHTARRAVVDRVEKLRVLLPEADRTAIYDMALSMWLPGEIGPLLGGDYTPRASFGGVRGTFADQMSHCDLRHYLPDDILTKVDRTTMAVGLEGREPLLDHRLVEFALRLPLEMRRGSLGTKHLLRKILYRHVPRPMIDRPKRGFAIPLARWLRGELSGLLEVYLNPGRVRAAGILDPHTVERTVRNLREGGETLDRVDANKVWLLLAFEMWRERWA
jgi:asparagine synthase (glutamine-hydrolysing)